MRASDPLIVNGQILDGHFFDGLQNDERLNPAEELKSKPLGIRRLFRFAIFAVVLGASLIFALASFASISSSERTKAEASMASEVNYLCLQLESLGERAEAFDQVVSSSATNPKELESKHPEAYHLLSDEVGDVLEGYTLAETGTVVIIANGTVVASDDDRVPVGSNAEEVLGSEICTSIETSLDTGETQTIPFEGVFDEPGGKGSYGDNDDTAYLLAGQQGDYTVMIIEPESMVFRDRTAAMLRETAIALVLLFVVGAIVDRLLSVLVARRIDKTNEALKRITSGDLNALVEGEGTQEFRSLAVGINATVMALRSTIEEVQHKNAQELLAAKAIQESSLPHEFPPFPDIDEFDLYASMKPAKEVGGDFYDFFLIDEKEGKLGFVIADVSGKGIPAALFMMAAKTHIENYMMAGLDLGKAVNAVNHQLCVGNDAGMFVTAWLGELDYNTGVLTYVNAGHNPPMMQHDGTWEWMSNVSGMPLGLFDGIPYEQFELQLQPGAVLFTYTDGVTEAMNQEGELFGEERLERTLNGCTTMNTQLISLDVTRALAEFTLDCEQSDDTTMLVLKYDVSPEKPAMMVLDADDSHLGQVLAFIHDELERCNAPESVYYPLDIATEELFVNVCHYAYPEVTDGSLGEVRIELEYDDDPRSLTVTISDDGVPYNPLDKPDAVIPDNIMDAPIGGLGILMAKKSVDEMRYQRIGGSNVLTFVKKW